MYFFKPWFYIVTVSYPRSLGPDTPIFLFIITDKTRVRGEEVRRCRCYERQRDKPRRDGNLSPTRWIDGSTTGLVPLREPIQLCVCVIEERGNGEVATRQVIKETKLFIMNQ
jgi:hypothetical protein